MLALSPLFGSFGWSLEDQVSNDQNWIPSDLMKFNYTEPHTSSQPQMELDYPRSSGATSSDPSNTKKVSHNASERNRRKKLNSLYSSLRSLLPGTDQMKKLSIPNTISRVLKYIPELQSQVEGLIQRKEEILSHISKKSDVGYLPKQSKGTNTQSLPTVSTSQINDSQVVVQICASKVKISPLSEVLSNLEEGGFQILNASVFASCENRVFYALHLQVKETQRLECEVLSEKILSLC